MSRDHLNRKNRKLVYSIAVLFSALCLMTACSGDAGTTDSSTPVPTNGTISEQPGNTTAAPDNNGKSVKDDKAENNPTDTEKVNQGADTEDTDKNKVTVTLGEYKGLSIKYEPKTITDEDIDNILKKLQSDNSGYVQLPDRAFKEGDMAIVVYLAQADGKEVKELSGEYLQVIIGEGMMGTTIENEMIGKRIGDRFECDIDYPEDYPYVPEVSGKTVHFTIWLEDGFELFSPEIDDEFVNNASIYSTVEEFYTKEKERLQNEENENALERMHTELKTKVIEGCTYQGPIDDKILTEYVRKLRDNDEEYKELYYVDAATYYAMTYDMSAEEYQKSVREEATMDVKLGYALDEIMTRENLASREEAEKLIYDTAVVSGM